MWYWYGAKASNLSATADDPAKDMNLMTEVLNKTPQELVPELVTWE